jgi:hypothetical protein
MERFGGGLGAGRREAPKTFNKEYYFDDNRTIGGPCGIKLRFAFGIPRGGLMRAPPKADGENPTTGG